MPRIFDFWSYRIVACFEAGLLHTPPTLVRTDGPGSKRKAQRLSNLVVTANRQCPRTRCSDETLVRGRKALRAKKAFNIGSHSKARQPIRLTASSYDSLNSGEEPLQI
jgi:hypothetical protein